MDHNKHTTIKAMHTIPNLAGIPAESHCLVALRAADEPLWIQLKQAGYEVTLPDMLGRCDGDLSWYVEVCPHISLGWIFCHRDNRYLGSQIRVAGEPAAAVAAVVGQLQLLVAQESLSGVETRTMRTQMLDVAAA